MLRWAVALLGLVVVAVGMVAALHGSPPSDRHPPRGSVRIVVAVAGGSAVRGTGHMAVDLVIDIENSPGALAGVAAAISDAGVNIAAATGGIGTGNRAEFTSSCRTPARLGIRWAITHLAITREREVVVIDVEDRPGVLADLTRKVARAGVDLDLVYVATRNRVVFGAPDLDRLKAALDEAAEAMTGPPPRGRRRVARPGW